MAIPGQSDHIGESTTQSFTPAPRGVRFEIGVDPQKRVPENVASQGAEAVSQYQQAFEGQMGTPDHGVEKPEVKLSPEQEEAIAIGEAVTDKARRIAKDLQNNISDEFREALPRYADFLTKKIQEIKNGTNPTDEPNFTDDQWNLFQWIQRFEEKNQ